MRTALIFTFALLTCSFLHAQQISGLVKDDQDKPLPFSTILVKNTTLGVTANNEGRFQLNLKPGTYTIVCQHVGYTQSQRTVTIPGKDTVLFVLKPQQLSMGEVIIKKGEDPAYEIIRHAIKERKRHQDELKNFQCEVYIKGQMRLRDYPKKFLGQKVDFEDGDTSKKKIIFLSETVANYYKQAPNNEKVEVVSTRVSGESGGYGLATPQFVTFYDNNVSVGEGLNSRGFISPIAAGALHYYNYKYEGCFWEDGHLVDQIKVMPKRKYEPLFSGHINIVEDEWRIHSVDLLLTRGSQMQLLDTLNIQQVYAPYSKDIWILRSQVIYPTIKIFSFDAYGSFATVYSKFDVDPVFGKNLFNKTVLKYDSTANKKAKDYWDTIRPIPLANDELLDYKKKDSIEVAHKDPHYLDSLDRVRNQQGFFSVLYGGMSFNNTKKKTYYHISGLASGLGYNTVEGVNLTEDVSLRKQISTSKSLLFSGTARYGFSNHHFDGVVGANYFFRTKKHDNLLSLSGGRYVYQFDGSNPISPLMNSVYTLFAERNYMKLYRAWVGNASYTYTLDNGLSFRVGANYQARTALENTSALQWKKYDSREFTPNYPVNLVNAPMPDNDAFSTSLSITWRPGSKYIEFPDRKYSIGSKYPTFSFSYVKGIDKVFGSDVNYDKWRFSVSDDLNLKIGGLFSYRLIAGGFLNDKKVQLPDYNHVNGDQTIFAASYLSAYQLAPYYQYSNTARFYFKGFAEHHFNGLLTNKIPLFRRLNWFLVGGANTLYLSGQNNYYIEAFGGLENIFKIIRVDYVTGFQKNGPTLTGFRIGLKLGSSSALQ